MQSSLPTDQAGDSPVECDVLVIGGGPAGSTVAALLAQKGRHVVLLDKDRHPRFHIGESLLPANLPLFERLGVADEMRAIGIKKRAAEFMSPWHEHKQQFLFADAWDKTMPHAYQVRRSEFDQVLLRRATQLGAHVREGCKVTAVDLEATPERARAQARCDDGRTLAYAPRFVVDASGRDTFLASRFQIKHKNPQHNSVAVYGHFENVRRNEGEDEGNIIIFWFEHGWFWFIPLQDGVTSIGMVTWPYFMDLRGHALAQAGEQRGGASGLHHAAAAKGWVHARLLCVVDEQRNQGSSRGQSTAPEWVTAPWCAGRTVRAYFSSNPPRRRGSAAERSASRCAIWSAVSSTAMRRADGRASMSITSPSRSAAMGPPSAASGPA